MAFPIIKYFQHEGHIVVGVIYNITAGIFEHLDIIYLYHIDRRWIYFDQVLMGPALITLRNYVLFCKYISEETSGKHWSLGEPYNVVLGYFWDSCNVDGLECEIVVITIKYQWIDLCRTLWFMLCMKIIKT